MKISTPDFVSDNNVDLILEKIRGLSPIEEQGNIWSQRGFYFLEIILNCLEDLGEKNTDSLIENFQLDKLKFLIFSKGIKEENKEKLIKFIYNLPGIDFEIVFNNGFYYIDTNKMVNTYEQLGYLTMNLKHLIEKYQNEYVGKSL